MSEACACDGPGFCRRHGLKKGPHWFHLCQTRDDYRQAWDEGHGPGQAIADLPRRPPVDPAEVAAQLARLKRCQACPECHQGDGAPYCLRDRFTSAESVCALRGRFRARIVGKVEECERQRR